MCGIAGGFNSTSDVVQTMLDRIVHRGPDGRGIKHHDSMIHGHVRLALVDLTEASAQPFTHRNITLSFNGEIWNYLQLKQNSPSIYSTTGDTEVVADFLFRYGLGGLQYLDGMYAIAFSDQHGGHYLARDPFGKIPLYIAKTKTGYLYASERKAFPRNLKPIPVPPGYAFDLNNGS